MGWFNSGAGEEAQHTCIVLQKREKVLTLVTSKKVDDILAEAYALDPRLCDCIENWSGNQSDAGLFKKTYRLILEYAQYTPDNINDVILDDGTWKPTELISKGKQLPPFVRVVTESPQDLTKRFSEAFDDLRGANPGLLGAKTYTGQPFGSHTSMAFVFNYCVDMARADMWMQSAKRRVAEIDKSCFGVAPKLIKVFLAYSYLQQSCRYDHEMAEIIAANPENPQLNRPWVILPYGPLCRGEGVCEGISAAFKLFMDYFGIENKLVFGRAGEGSDVEDHRWNMIKLSDQWFHVDPTAGIDGEGVYVGAFLKSDGDMESTYLWDTSRYPKCVVRRPDYSTVEAYVEEHFDELLDSGVEERYMSPEDISE